MRGTIDAEGNVGDGTSIIGGNDGASKNYAGNQGEIDASFISAGGNADFLGGDGGPVFFQILVGSEGDDVLTRAKLLDGIGAIGGGGCPFGTGVIRLGIQLNSGGGFASGAVDHFSRDCGSGEKLDRIGCRLWRGFENHLVAVSEGGVAIVLHQKIHLATLREPGEGTDAVRVGGGSEWRLHVWRNPKTVGWCDAGLGKIQALQRNVYP